MIEAVACVNRIRYGPGTRQHPHRRWRFLSRDTSRSFPCKLVQTRVGKRNADPIAPRNDFGENGSLVFRVVITPLAPAASAVLRMAPTFTGLLI